MSALYRMAYGSHKQVEVNSGDRILIAASAIPGNEKSINNMVNELYKQGAEVIYDRFGSHPCFRPCLPGGS